mgnify:CR=1 FL=1
MVGTASSTLIEVGPLFQVEYASSGFSYSREMIMAGHHSVAVRSIRNDGTLTTRYLTSDHLGSVSEITDEVGGVDERMSYAAFGERRDPATWGPLTSTASLTDITDQGYTNQQQLDAVGLVHMGGRVYDPVIGRFISADPTVPDPLYSQAFNRYAYVYDNPLSLTDPSGYCPGSGDPLNLADCSTFGTPFCSGSGNFSCGANNVLTNPGNTDTAQLGKIVVTAQRPTPQAPIIISAPATPAPIAKDRKSTRLNSSH